jgi:hypothetical protein
MKEDSIYLFVYPILMTTTLPLVQSGFAEMGKIISSFAARLRNGIIINSTSWRRENSPEIKLHWLQTSRMKQENLVLLQQHVSVSTVKFRKR